MTTDVVLGQPWHGKLTPAGLVLADSSVKTAMQGTDANGNPKTFNYIWSGDAYMGDTLYVKTPGMPAPTTPASMAAIGGEFKNDAVLFGVLRRYSPFSGGVGLTALRWVHYGADGVWRRMELTRSVDSLTQVTVVIRRRGPFLSIGGGPAENTVIATLTLTTDIGAGVMQADLAVPGIDARFDGRQILVTRWGMSADPSDPLLGYAPWNSSDKLGIVAVWRIDIPDTCDTATVTRIWHRTADVYSESRVRTNLVSQGVVVTGGPYPTAWEYWEDFEGVLQTAPDTHTEFSRLVAASFMPSGTISLVEYRYNNDYTGSSRRVRGRIYKGSGVSVTPNPPAQSPPITAEGNWVPVYPGEEILEQYPSGPDYTISLTRNGTVIHVFDTPGNSPIYASRITNNVSSLIDGSVSIARVGPDVIDMSPSSFAPLYASYNPRTSTVHTSATPIGFC